MSVSERLVREWEQRIYRGEWRPGERLPAERQLAEDYSAGRPSVREALVRLSQRGLVSISPQSGAYVTDLLGDLSLDRLFALLENGMYPEPAVFAGLLEYRSCLETGALEIPLRSDELPPPLLLDLRQHLFVIKLSSNSGELVLHDRLFHERLMDLSPNPVLRRLFLDTRPLQHAAGLRLFSRLENREAVRHGLSELLKALSSGSGPRSLKLLRSLLREQNRMILEERPGKVSSSGNPAPRA